MARYLSPEWFADVAAHSPAPVPGGAAVVIGQVVTGAPEGEVRYRVVVADGAATLVAGDEPPADVTFTSDYATAAAVASGELSMQAALGAGRVRVGGDLARLAAAVSAGELPQVDPVPAAVRASTTWPEP